MTKSMNPSTPRRASLRAGAISQRATGSVARRPHPIAMPRINPCRGDDLHGWPQVVEDDAEEALSPWPADAEPDDHDPLAEEIFGLAALEAIYEHAPAIEVVIDTVGRPGGRP